MAKKQKKTAVKIPRKTKVILGGLAGMVSTALAHPLDLIKVRLQLYNKPCTSVQMARNIIRCEGGSALYKGLTAGLMRQATYTTTRLAVNYWLYDDYKSTYGKHPNLHRKVVIGVVAGAAGALAGNPAEMALVRLMGDVAPEPCAPYRYVARYRGLIDAITKIIHQESVCALWRGGMLTLWRSVFVSGAQISAYAQVANYSNIFAHNFFARTVVNSILKERKLANGLQLHLFTSLISSYISAVFSLPVDFVKTSYQIRTDRMTQTQILANVLKDKGVLFLWQGFVPYYLRMSFHTVVTFYVLEGMYKVYRKYEHPQNNK